MARRKSGRPSKYTRKLGDEICLRLAEGGSLVKICEDPKMPHRSTVLTWALGQVEDASIDGFPDRYAQARDVQAEVFIDQAIPISDDTEGEQSSAAVQAAKLRVDTRKWYASKLRPAVYGERKAMELTGKGGGPIETSSVDWSKVPIDLRRQVLACLEGDGDVE